MSIPYLTVGIVFRNEEEKILRCLSSLQFLRSEFPDLQLILVDNASTDRSVELAQGYLQSEKYSFEIIRRERNHMAEARNDVVSRAKNSYLYFMDADCEQLPTTWTELKKIVEAHPTYAAWGGGAEFPQDNDFQRALNDFRKFFWGHFGSAQMMDGGESRDVEHLSTMHVLYKVSALQEIGGFDSRLGQSAEDLDLSLRLRVRGFRMRFSPTSKILHFQFSNAQEWTSKAFRNGIWQTRLLAYNPKILKTSRPWPGLLSLWFFPFWIHLFTLYLFLIAGFSLAQVDRSWSERVRLLQVSVLTHLAYGFGEVFGIFLAIRDKAKWLMAPASTKN